MTRLRRRLLLAGGGAALAAPALRAQGIWNPTRSVTLVVGFPPGGRTDLAARAIKPGLQEALGVAVEVDHRVGASGNAGTEAAMGARPDGYTLLVGNTTTMAVHPHIMDAMTVDPREMVAVGLVQHSALALCAHPSTGLRDLAGLRAWLAAQPSGSVHYGSAGTGSLSHLAMTLLRERLGRPAMTHVPARGNALALEALMAGRSALMFNTASIVAPMVQDQRLRGVLVTGETRSPSLPGLGTAGEQGLADFTFSAWVGLFAPRATPPQVVARLNAALNTALADPATRTRMAARGEEPGGGAPQRMARIMAEDHARWERVARDHNIRAES